MVKVTVSSRPSKKAGKKSKPSIEVDFPSKHPDKVSVLDLKNAIHAKFPKMYPARQRLTTATNVPLKNDDDSISSYGVGENAELFLKDLGPQSSWRTVYMIEYIGPIIVHPFFYYAGPYIYDFALRSFGFDSFKYERSRMQFVAMVIMVLHFLKREYETIFVHRFSNGTMPTAYIFRNSAHYWLLAGLLVALGLNGPWNGATAWKELTLLPEDSVRNNSAWIGFWCTFIAVGEFANLKCHEVLRDLRPAGTKKRGVPKGWGFDIVSCANYMWEVFVWTSFTFMTGSLCSAIFLVVGSLTMAKWAKKRQRNYRKEFDDYPKSRKAIFPFLY